MIICRIINGGKRHLLYRKDYMEFILLLIILFVCLCSKVNTDVAVSQSKKKATEKIEKSNNWRDRTFDSFIVPEITEYIVAEENAEEIAELIEELSKAAPELRQHPIILYNYQMNSTFTQKEKDMVAECAIKMEKWWRKTPLKQQSDGRKCHHISNCWWYINHHISYTGCRCSCQDEKLCKR